MKQFSYRAVDRDDRRKEGAVLALDRVDAGRKLMDQGLYPLEIIPARSISGLLNVDIGARRLSRSETAQLLNDIGNLVSAGIEVATALSLVKTTGPHRSREAVHQMLESVRRGLSLSSTMKEAPAIFPAPAVAIVAAGEASNSLGPSLLRVADSLRKSAALRSQIQTSLIYPGCIAIAVVAAIAVLIVVVVPTLEGLFGDHTARLPWQTRLLIAVSETVRNHAFATLLLVACIVATPIALLSVPRTKAWLERLALRVPMLGEFLQSVESAQLSAMLATLTVAGVPLVDTVAMARSGARLSISRQALDEAIVQLREGRRLHEALRNVSALSPRVLAIVQIGESTGRLGKLMEEASRDAERRVTVMTERVLAILPPAMTLGFGAIAGFVLYAVMTAILSVNTLATRGV